MDFGVKSISASSGVQVQLGEFSGQSSHGVQRGAHVTCVSWLMGTPSEVAPRICWDRSVHIAKAPASRSHPGAPRLTGDLAGYSWNLVWHRLRVLCHTACLPLPEDRASPS